MLYISFKETEDTLRGIDGYFNYNYEEEWFDNDLVKQMVKDVDKSEVISSECIKSPVLGQIPPTKLSGGVKVLIVLLMEPELEQYATSCGDNCAEWILKISEMQDIHIVLHHIMKFPRDFEAVCVDNGVKIHTREDYIQCVTDCFYDDYEDFEWET